MGKLLEIALLAVGFVVIPIISLWVGHQAYGWLPAQATAEAIQVDRLFSFLMVLGTAVFLAVTGTIAWAIATCRAPRGDFTEGHPGRSNTRLEVIWTIVPTLLVIWIAWQSQHIYDLLDIRGLSTLPKQAISLDSTESDVESGQLLSVEVDAKQWSWSFRYPAANITSDELHLPVDRPVKLVLNAEDVLHGFYVPEFRLKQDMIPGRPIELVLTPRQEGQYRLQDSQFSGTYFALMEAKVLVETSDSFAQWLANPSSIDPTKTTNLAAREYKNNSHLLGSRWPTVIPKG